MVSGQDFAANFGTSGTAGEGEEKDVSGIGYGQKLLIFVDVVGNLQSISLRLI